MTMKLHNPERVLKNMMQCRLPKWGMVEVINDIEKCGYIVNSIRREPRNIRFISAEFDNRDMDDLQRLKARADLNAKLMTDGIQRFEQERETTNSRS